MVNIKVTISLNPDLLEALDKVAQIEMKNRSVKITEILRNDSDIWNMLRQVKNATITR